MTRSLGDAGLQAGGRCTGVRMLLHCTDREGTHGDDFYSIYKWQLAIAARRHLTLQSPMNFLVPSLTCTRLARAERHSTVELPELVFEHVRLVRHSASRCHDSGTR